MCSAAKAIGNTELENKFAEGEDIWQQKFLLVWEEFTSSHSTRSSASHLQMFAVVDDLLAHCKVLKHVSSDK